MKWLVLAESEGNTIVMRLYPAVFNDGCVLDFYDLKRCKFGGSGQKCISSSADKSTMFTSCPNGKSRN